MLLQGPSMFEAMQNDVKLFEVVRMLRSRFEICFVKFRDVRRGSQMIRKVVHVISELEERSGPITESRCCVILVCIIGHIMIINI